MKKNLKTKMGLLKKINVGIFTLCAIVCFLLSQFFPFPAQYSYDGIVEYDENYGENIAYVGDDESGNPRYDSDYYEYIEQGICPCYVDENKKCEEWFHCQDNDAVMYNLENAPENLLDIAKENYEEMSRFEGLNSHVTNVAYVTCWNIFSVLFLILGCVFSVVAVTYLIHNLDK